MATAYRSSQSVTNGSAGTSVTVSKPSGIVDTGANPDRDLLVAFVAAVGAPTFTEPAGWTLITTAVDAGNNVTLKAYRKLASSEGASWTWTLGSSARNWGWVGAYTGVDPDEPVFAFNTDITLTSSTILAPDTETDIPRAGHGISAGAAVRTASGAATTWTHSSTERVDLSTNAGAGTDISGVVGDSQSTNGLGGSGLYLSAVVASQAQSAGALIALTLTPYFVPYDASVGGAGVIIEAAFGVDPDTNSGDWTWTDLTSYVHHPAKIVLTHGRANWSPQADPSSLKFTLLNLNGEFTHPAGAYATSMVRSLPFRVRINGFGVTSGGFGYHRGTMFLASMKPRWDASLNFSVVDIVAQGRLRRLQQRSEALKSAAYTAIQRVSSSSGYVAPLVYWPFEDDVDATVAATAAPDTGPLYVPGITFAADSAWTGSAPLAQLSDFSLIEAPVPSYADTGQWIAICCLHMPTEPASTVTVLQVLTGGTAARWQVDVVPGTTEVRVRAYDTSGANILDDIGVVPDEVNFYDVGQLITLETRQNGVNIDWQLYVFYGMDWHGNFGTYLGGVKVGTLSSYTNGTANFLRVPPNVDLDGVGYGHLALHTSAAISAGSVGIALTNPVLEGNSNEWPYSRIQRLCLEQGIPYVVDQSTNEDLTVGPQSVATFMTLAREAELVEGCVLNDSGESTLDTGLLWFPARDDRENIAATMTLDMSAGEVITGFEPVLDDQAIVNDFEASRDGGSTARARDEVSIATEGIVRGGDTFNLYDDTFLPHIAGWRVNLGTVKGMRFPSVGWNLRRSPTLAEAWMACRLFARIDITNPPSQYPPDTIEAILEGYTETFSMDEWTVRANLSPYAPNKVFEISTDAAPDTNEFAGRLAGDPDAAIRGALTDSATSIPFDPNNFRWTTVSDHFSPAMPVWLGGEKISLSGISTTAATVVAAGTASHANNAAVSPALYAGATANDLICVLGRIRGTTGSLATPSGYTLMRQAGGLYFWAKVHSGTESAPTLTPSGGSSGDTVSGITFGLRNMPVTLADLTDMLIGTACITQYNASAQNIGYGGVHTGVIPGCVVLVLAGKSDDYTSAAITGLTELAEASTTTGNDQSMYIAYSIQTTPTVVNGGSITVTGGASAVSESMVVALAGGFQTMTASARGVNGVTKAHAAGTKVAVGNAYVLGL